MTESVFELDLDELFAEEGYVRRLARGLLLDDHAVDDVVQQTWLAALHNPPTAPNATRGWLGTVVRRLAANRARTEGRRRRREQRIAAPESAASIDDVLAREERRREVVEVLDALDEPYRTVVALRYLEGLEPVEIAQRLQVPAATVRTQVRRGLEKMRQRLDANHGERMVWCTALLPIARGRNAMVATTTGVSGGVFATLLAVVLLVSGWFWWPPAAVTPPANTDSGSVLSAARGDELGPARREEVRAQQPKAPGQSRIPKPGVVGALRGRFLKPDGSPLAGTRVEAFAFDGARLFGGDAFLPEAVATTAADGSFVLRGLPVQARCVAVADANGDLRQLVPMPVSPAHGKVLDAGEFRLQPRVAATGIVVDDAQRPVAGAEVFTADLPGLVLAAFPIDRFVPEHGVVTMVPKPKAATSGQPAPDWYDQLNPHLAWRVAKTDYGELPSASFVPVVLDGTPLLPLLDRLPFARATTGADGSFRLRGVVPGRNVLVARANGRSTAVRTGQKFRVKQDHDVGTLQLPEGNELTGRVMDTSGAPVGGALVRVASIALFGFRGVAPCEAEVQTAADGTFAVTGLSRGKAVVVFRRVATDPWQITGPLETDDEVDLTVADPVDTRLRLSGARFEDLRGLRMSARPSPPLGEMSRLGMASSFAPLQVQPGEVEGEYLARLAPGVWTLRCELPGYAPQKQVVVAPAAGPVEIAMVPTVSLDVAVVDAQGNACPDVAVFVQSAGDADERSAMLTSFKLERFEDPWPCQRAVTDERGRVQVAVRTGGVRLSVQGGALGCGVLETEVSAADRVTLQLGSVGGVFGAVEVGTSMGADPRAYRVVVDRVGADAAGPVAASVTTRPGIDGSYRCAQLPPGRYRVALSEPLLGSLSFGNAIQWLDDHSSPFFQSDQIHVFEIEVHAGSDTRVDFAIGGLDSDLGGVVGVVTVDGLPAVGAKVWRRNRERMGQAFMDAGNEDRPRATIGVDGAFVVDDLEPGTHWLHVYEATTRRILHVFEVEVESSLRTPVRADVKLGVASAFVLQPDGTPAVGERVLLREVSPSGQELLSYGETTDAAGKVEFARVPTGRYRFSVYGRHLMFDGEAFAVVAGNNARPRKLVGKTIYRLQVELADSVALQGSSVTYCVREVGSHAWNTHMTGKRSAELGLLEGGEYELRLRIGDVYYDADPKFVTVSLPQQKVVVGQGAQQK